MRCDTLSLELAGAVDGSDAMAPETERHVDTCLRCQAELAQYRKLLRALTALRGQFVVPDDDLLEDLLRSLQPEASVTRLHRLNYRNRKAAYIGGIAAAATAGAAGAIVIASRLASKQRLAS